MMRFTSRPSHAYSVLINTAIVTTDEVLAEFLTFFSNRLRRRAVETVRELARDPNVRILPRKLSSRVRSLCRPSR